jgi:hypothetical protein
MRSRTSVFACVITYLLVDVIHRSSAVQCYECTYPASPVAPDSNHCLAPDISTPKCDGVMCGTHVATGTGQSSIQFIKIECNFEHRDAVIKSD